MSLLGVTLVGVGYAIVWTVRRPPFTRMFDSGPFLDWMIAFLDIVIGVGSVMLVLSAVRTLGSQWNIEAWVADDHTLVRDGPYSIVRHPIYAGMMGLMISTGLAFSSPYWLLVAVIVAWYGTHLRIRSEEALLKETFGTTYGQYAKEVPPLIPGTHWIS